MLALAALAIQRGLGEDLFQLIGVAFEGRHHSVDLRAIGGIYRRGAGLGPAIAFLYAGPAINVLAIVYSARLLGYDIGIARAVGAVLFSVVIGFIMATIYRKEESKK